MRETSWLTRRPVAHRGLHDAARGIIENTPSAVRAAIAEGFAIEVDVQRARDGEAMVFHDGTLDRLTWAQGPLAHLSQGELAAIPFRQGPDRMMTLPQLLALVAGQVPLVVEIKSAFDGDVRLATRTAQLLADYCGPAALMSFDPAQLVQARAVAPEVIRGIVAERRYDDADGLHLSRAKRFCLANLLHWPWSRFDFMAYRVSDLPAAAPAFGQLCRLPLLTWTVRSAEALARGRRHADQVIFEGIDPTPENEAPLQTS